MDYIGSTGLSFSVVNGIGHAEGGYRHVLISKNSATVLEKKNILEKRWRSSTDYDQPISYPVFNYP